MISMDQISHKYLYNNEVRTSVSAVCKEVAPYEKNYWTFYKTLEKAMGIEKFKAIKPETKPSIEWILKQAEAFPDIHFPDEADELGNEWANYGNMKADEGTEKHGIEEQATIAEEEIRSPFNMQLYKTKIAHKIEGRLKISLISNLSELEDGVYTELMLFYEDALYMGTTDRVFVDTFAGKRNIAIVDHKFCERIDRRQTMQNMKYPVQHMENSKYNRYNIQLSLYARLFELSGFNVKHLALNHKGKYLPMSYLCLEAIRLEDYLVEKASGFSPDILDTPMLL